MEFDDRLTIATPEGVRLNLTLAGAASRFVSAVVDLAIQGVTIIVLVLIASSVGTGTHSAAAVALLVSGASFFVIVGYDVCFEVLNAGRTPGKRLNGLRVVRVGGQPIGFLTSAIRNVIRLIDFLPSAYLLGATLILATPKNQRLGDIIAGTVVIRERTGSEPRLPAFPGRAGGDEPPPLPAWDTSLVTPAEAVTVRRFLERRDALDRAARAQIARTLDSRLRPRVTGVGGEVSPEEFLRDLVALKDREV